jgi:hypothetical protein
MVLISTNAHILANQLHDLEENFLEAEEKGFAAAGHEIVERMKNEQLSGRTGGDMGLNIKTGRLHDSIKSLTTVDGGKVSSEVFNEGAAYWFYHQHGTPKLKKRLNLEEFFIGKGPEIYLSHVKMALQGLPQ